MDLFSGLRKMVEFLGNEDRKTEEQRQEVERLWSEETAVNIQESMVDQIMHFSHVVACEGILGDYAVYGKSFKATMEQVNLYFDPVFPMLCGLVRQLDPIPLTFDPETSQFTLGDKDFDRSCVPFHIGFVQDGIFVESPAVGAIFAEMSLNHKVVKRVTLNRFEGQDFIADGTPIPPSSLVLALKYGIHHLDPTKIPKPTLDEFVLWERSFQTMALLFDFMRSNKHSRSIVASVIVHHCSAHYRVPANLALRIIDYAQDQRTPFSGAHFKISLDFVPQPCAVRGAFELFSF
jgi:hypothetical protein